MRWVTAKRDSCCAAKGECSSTREVVRNGKVFSLSAKEWDERGTIEATDRSCEHRKARRMRGVSWRVRECATCNTWHCRGKVGDGNGKSNSINDNTHTWFTFLSTSLLLNSHRLWAGWLSSFTRKLRLLFLYFCLSTTGCVVEHAEYVTDIRQRYFCEYES